MHGQALAKARIAEQPVDDFLVGVRRVVAQKIVKLGQGRRQAGEVERHPAEPLFAPGQGRRLDVGLAQLGQGEVVNLVLRPSRLAKRRHFDGGDRHERPMLPPLGALLDPAAD